MSDRPKSCRDNINGTRLLVNLHNIILSYVINNNNKLLYLIMHDRIIVDGHVLLLGNIVVIVVVIKRETFSALGDNHILI